MPDPGFMLGPSPVGRWDDSRTSCPVVARDHRGYWMWYYGREQGFPGITPEQERGVLPCGRTGLATSPDGVTWTKIDGPGFRGSVFDPNPEPGRFDSFQVGGSDIVRRDHEWWLYYIGTRESSSFSYGELRKGFPLNIGLAVSNDGLNFQRYDGPHDGAVLTNGLPDDWDAYYSGFPRILTLPGGGFRLYYSGGGPTGRAGIGAAESPDGFHWEKIGKIFEPNPDPAACDAASVGSRSIVTIPGGYFMVYEAVDLEFRFRIAMATSTDGLTWERLPGRGPKGSLIEYGAAGSFDDRAMGTPYLLREPNGALRLYHVGFSTKGVSGIGLCVSDGQDLTHWERYQWGNE